MNKDDIRAVVIVVVASVALFVFFSTLLTSYKLGAKTEDMVMMCAFVVLHSFWGGIVVLIESFYGKRQKRA
jgi:hypothetical protein